MSTSVLQQLVMSRVYTRFAEFEIIENYRPEWMISSSGHRLEIDIFIPELNIAIEIQGEQHFRFVEKFHVDYDGFLKQVERDAEKKQILSDLQIPLFEILSESEIPDLLDNISRATYSGRNLSRHPLYDLIPVGTLGLKESVRLIHEATCYERIAKLSRNKSDREFAKSKAIMLRLQSKMISDKMYLIKHPDKN